MGRPKFLSLPKSSHPASSTLPTLDVVTCHAIHIALLAAARRDGMLLTSGATHRTITMACQTDSDDTTSFSNPHDNRHRGTRKGDESCEDG